MSENIIRPVNPALFFISRIFILVGMVLFFGFVFLALGMVFSGYLFGVNLLTDPTVMQNYETDPAVLNAMKFVQGMTSIGSFLVPALLFPRALQQWPSVFNRSDKRPAGKFIWISLALMIVSAPLVAQLIEWNEGFRFPPEMAEVENKLRQSQAEAERLMRAFLQAGSTGGFLINFFLVAILPAICEEFLFRGAFLRFLLFCFNRKHAAVIISAVVFSMLHGEFYGLVPRIALGILLGYMAVYSGSIWPGVAAHLLNNAIALCATHFQWAETGLFFLAEDYVFPVYLSVISTAITVGGVWWMQRMHKEEALVNGE